MLFIVSTPIGNLEDISLRAIRLLKESDYVLAEDTRRTSKLFKHYEIKNKLISFNDFNKEKKTHLVIQDLESEKNICLVSDSGTPGISDPGFYLIRECVKNNITVSPVPGPTAVISALVCSGLPTDKFTFYGFLPKSRTKVNDILNKIKKRKETAVPYESPHRILKTLAIMSEVIPEKDIVIARELTKKFEEFIRGTPKEILSKIQNRKLKGEITVVIY